MKQSNTAEFIEKAKRIHGVKYDYSKVEYVNSTTPVEIICPVHGSFFQTPKSHLRGNGCKKCGYESNSEKHKRPNHAEKIKKKWTYKGNIDTEEFIRRAEEVHGKKYDYSKTEYVNEKTKVCIICPEHGEFWQTPSNHLYGGKGCIKCSTRYPIYEEEFAKRLNGKYPSMKIIEYCGYNKKSLFYCGEKDENGNEHGNFFIRPHDLISDRQICSCPKCASERRRRIFQKSQEDFISEAKVVHGENRYDYSKVNYVNRGEKVCIICHEKDEFGNEHGEFWQTPANHLRARGCPLCKSDKLVYENKLYSVLLEIFEPEEIIRQYRNESVFGNLSLDFYIPKYKIAIEHQGSQHLGPVSYFGGQKKYEQTRKNDFEKYSICKKNNVYLFYFSYESYWVPDEYFDKVYTSIKEFRKIIESLISNSNE